MKKWVKWFFIITLFVAGILICREIAVSRAEAGSSCTDCTFTLKPNGIIELHVQTGHNFNNYTLAYTYKTATSVTLVFSPHGVIRPTPAP